MRPRIGIIGGSGVYDPEMFTNVESVKMTTPYGPPSSSFQVGEFKDEVVAFIPRHGPGHVIPPHSVNYRANIAAMRDLGVEYIISPCAVGSLKEDYRPGEIVIVDQFIDFTKGRNYTFFDGGKTYHISVAEPMCPKLRAIFKDAAQVQGIEHHDAGTYVCIEGPRFSTKAESKMFSQFADIIGMTLVPEAQLAMEAGLCYVSLATVTDYDVWKEHTVTIDEIISMMTSNIEKIKKLLEEAIPKIPKDRICHCKDIPKNAEV